MAGEIQEYTTQIIEQLGLVSDSYPNENKMFKLDFGGRIVVNYADLHPGVYFVSAVGPIPERGREVVITALMHLNLLGKGTADGVIGYDEEIKQLTFSMAVPYRVQFGEFKNKLEDFVNYVELWKEELKKATEQKKNVLMAIN